MTNVLWVKFWLASLKEAQYQVDPFEVTQPSTIRVLKSIYCADRTVLYLNYIYVKILGMILYYSFARYHRWRKLSKVYTESFCIIPYNHM